MTDLEQAWKTTWKIVDADNRFPPKSEFKFSKKRAWRFDFAWPRARVAVEMEGGTFTGGRHVRPTGFQGDCDKYNTAASRGWLVFRFTAKHMKQDPVGCVQLVFNTVEASLEPPTLENF